jgi:hypothetical protein
MKHNGAISRTAAEIELKPTDWLWPERIPMNAITVLAGDPGLGKSLLTIGLVAKLSRDELGRQQGNALMLATVWEPSSYAVAFSCWVRLLSVPRMSHLRSAS